VSGAARPVGLDAAGPVRRFAFYGRVSTEDNQDPEASCNWQKSRSRALIDPVGGIIVAEYFDVGQSRSLPWKRRPRAAQLLADLADPGRGFDGVVIGEPQRAFYGNQYSLVMPVLTHYGAQLWVPEVGGPVDPDSEAHDLIMSVFGGLSKGERNRVKLRVRAAMSARLRWRAGSSAAGRRTATGSPMPGRTPTRPRPPTASACTSSNPTRTPPGWSGGSSPSTSPAAACSP
jgi:site-specific DNA recombinase